MDRAPALPANEAPSVEASCNLTGDALLQSEEFVEIALACFAAGVSRAVAEVERLKKAPSS